MIGVAQKVMRENELLGDGWLFPRHKLMLINKERKIEFTSSPRKPYGYKDVLVLCVFQCCCIHTLLMCEDIKIPYQAHYKAFINLTSLKKNF